MLKLVARIFFAALCCSSLFLRFQQNYFQICIQQNFRSLNKTLFCVDTSEKLFFPYKNVKIREYY